MRASVDYMNARRAAKPACGGTNYAVRDRVHDAATERAWAEMEQARVAQLDPIESLMEQVGDVFAEFRSWARNLPSIEYAMEMANDDAIPF